MKKFALLLLLGVYVMHASEKAPQEEAKPHHVDRRMDGKKSLTKIARELAASSRIISPDLAYMLLTGHFPKRDGKK